jgi:hypothetical protein
LKIHFTYLKCSCLVYHLLCFALLCAFIQCIVPTPPLLTMCHYRFYIFMGCGHSTSSSTPVSYCKDAVKLGRDRVDGEGGEPTAKATAELGNAKEAEPPEEPIVESRFVSSKLVADLDTAAQPEVTEIAQDELPAQDDQPTARLVEDTNKTLQYHAKEASSPEEPIGELQNASSKLALDVATAPYPTVTQPAQNSQPIAQLVENTDTTPKKPTRKRRPSPKKTEMQPCKNGRVHPLHTVKLERMICAVCATERDERLLAIESNSSEIRIEPSRWKWKHHGRGGARPLSTTNAEADKSPAAAGNVAAHTKVDSGTWSIGAMMKGLEGLGIVDRIN